MKRKQSGFAKWRIWKYFALVRKIKYKREKAMIEIQKEFLKNQIKLVDNRSKFFEDKFDIVQNIIDYQLELNAVTETQLRLIRELLGEPVMDKVRALIQMNFEDSSIGKLSLKDNEHDKKTNLNNDQKRDP